MSGSFNSLVNATIDKHAPLKKLSKREAKFKSKPWTTQGSRKSIKTKNKLFKHYITSKSLKLITLAIKFTRTN